MSKVSGPLLDRIDIQLEVPRLQVQEIMGKETSESSASIRERVEKAREVQRERYKQEGFTCNSALEPRQIERICVPDAEGERLLKMAIQGLGFSARAYHKVLKVARTIADLAQAETITAQHIAEAIHYRTLDKAGGLN